MIGDLAITTGCVRDDGTSRTYVVPEYPAVADYEASQHSSRDVFGLQHLARARLELASLRLEAGLPQEQISDRKSVV